MSLFRILTNLLTAPLAWPVAVYITRQRDQLSPLSRPLSAYERRFLQPYFAAADLERARVLEQNPLPIPDPPFAWFLRSLGLDFPTPSEVAGITFDHVIATREPMSPRTLFHELVHTVQYRLLGVNAFSHLYTRGFIEGRSYHAIPLERCALELDQDFDRLRPPFPVDDEVAAWIERGLF